MRRTSQGFTIKKKVSRILEYQCTNKKYDKDSYNLIFAFKDVIFSLRSPLPEKLLVYSSALSSDWFALLSLSSDSIYHTQTCKINANV